MSDSRRLFLTILPILIGASAFAQTTRRVSVGSYEAQANGPSMDPTASADGRYVAFWSAASNLVAADGNGVEDVFVRDLTLGTTVLISRSVFGAPGNGQSRMPAISADGQTVAFESIASNFYPPQSGPARWDVFSSGTSGLGYPQMFFHCGVPPCDPNGDSRSVSISNGGVAFHSDASASWLGDTNGFFDVYLYLGDFGELISVNPAGAAGNLHSYSPSASASGSAVAFASYATNLVPGGVDGNSDIDVFLRDLTAQTTLCLSLTPAGVTGNGQSAQPAISGDGLYVGFESAATNLVAGDTNGRVDIFVRDVGQAVSQRVSIDSSGAQSAGASSAPWLSSDGRYVAFTSDGPDLVPGDSNGQSDVFVHDRQLGTTELVSVGLTGASANGHSRAVAGSADARFIVFESEASNLVAGDTNGCPDVFVRDRQLGTTSRVSVSSREPDGSSISPDISGDGACVSFCSSATNLVPGDTNGCDDVFVVGLNAGLLERASVDGSGQQGNATSRSPSLSVDGRYVAFESFADNLTGHADTNDDWDVFRRDRQSGSSSSPTLCLGVACAVSNGASERPAIATDGSVVAFHSSATNLTPGGDANGYFDVYVDHALVSLSSNGTTGNLHSYAPSLSDDLRFVAFHSYASNLVPGDTNGVLDVFVHDVVTATTTRVSSNGAGGAADGPSELPSISGDGRYVVFQSDATDLVSGDSNGSRDVFVHDRSTGTTRRASVASGGAQTSGESSRPRISGQGRYVVFESTASTLVSGDTNQKKDVFVHDHVAGITERVSLSATGAQANGDSEAAAISDDGRFVVFASQATNLVVTDFNARSDIFVRDRGVALVFPKYCFGDGTTIPACPCTNNSPPGQELGCLNSLGVGAALVAGGDASISNDTLVLSGSQMPNSSALYYQGTSQTAQTFGDGLRCVSGAVIRLKTAINASGSSQYPAPGDSPISVRGMNEPGVLRNYQCWYRNAAAFCSPSTFNLSNGVHVAWRP